MIIADEWLLGAFVGVAGFFGYITRSLIFDIRKAIENNTVAVESLVTIVQRCDKK